MAGMNYQTRPKHTGADVRTRPGRGMERHAIRFRIRKTVSLNEDSSVPGSGLLISVHVVFGSAAGEDISYGRNAVS